MKLSPQQTRALGLLAELARLGVVVHADTVRKGTLGRALRCLVDRALVDASCDRVELTDEGRDALAQAMKEASSRNVGRLAHLNPTHNRSPFT